MTKSSIYQKMLALAMVLFLLAPVWLSAFLLPVPVSAARADAGEGVGAAEHAADEWSDDAEAELPGPELERLQFCTILKTTGFCLNTTRPNGCIPPPRSRS